MNTLKSQVQEKQREPQSNGLVLWPGWGRKAGAERRVCWLPDQRLAPAWLGRSWVPPTDGQTCKRSSCNWRPCINLSPLRNSQWVKGGREQLSWQHLLIWLRQKLSFDRVEPQAVALGSVSTLCMRPRKPQAGQLSQKLTSATETLVVPGRSFRIKLLCRDTTLTQAHSLPTIRPSVEWAHRPQFQNTCDKDPPRDRANRHTGSGY